MQNVDANILLSKSAVSLFQKNITDKVGCELLSKRIFDILETSKQSERRSEKEL